ncbi:MAG TPA: hypothetical protein VFT65_11230 [Candidatus Angelobacter sp.]|nr:hypothetical protein [Candidatus Angelobacter sp.]
MKAAELVLALIGTGLQAFLCLLFLLKRVHGQFHWFFAYTSFSMASTFLGLIVRNNPTLYFYIYWACEAGYVFLAFFSLQEAFRSVFRNFYSMRWFRCLFPSIGALLITIALLRTFLQPKPARSMVTIALFTLEIMVGLLQFAMFVGFVFLVRFFQLRWRQHALGVILGFGIAAAGTLIAYLLRSEFGTKFDPVVRIAPPIAYIMAVLVWLATFLRAEPSQPSTAAAITPEQMISELRRYTRVAKGVLGR